MIEIPTYIFYSVLIVFTIIIIDYLRRIWSGSIKYQVITEIERKKGFFMDKNKINYYYLFTYKGIPLGDKQFIKTDSFSETKDDNIKQIVEISLDSILRFLPYSPWNTNFKLKKPK